jgi:hypothetical protein
MSVGGQATTATMNTILTNLATQARLLFEQIRNLNTQVNGGTTAGVEYMASVIGYDNTSGNTSPQNPSGMTDAAAASYWVNLFWTLAQVYYGVLGQAAVGDAAVSENFDQGFAPLAGGQIN